MRQRAVEIASLFPQVCLFGGQANPVTEMLDYENFENRACINGKMNV